MTKRKNLVDIAEDVLEATLAKNPWRPNTDDIRGRHGLNVEQAKVVKQHVKRIAADRGILWSWHEAIGAFRAAPSNSPGTAKAMLDYGFRAWSDSGKSMGHLVRGARDQGFLEQVSADKVIRRTKDTARRVRAFGDSLTYQTPSK